jgi:hypothetical protein
MALAVSFSTAIAAVHTGDVSRKLIELCQLASRSNGAIKSGFFF